jgi:hypothetical protein
MQPTYRDPIRTGLPAQLCGCLRVSVSPLLSLLIDTGGSLEEGLALRAAAQLGRMKLLLPEKVNPGERLAAQILVKHPNSSGLPFDRVSSQYIPADYVKRIETRYRGQALFTADTDISISEDPSIRFSFVPDAPGELTVQVKDSKGRVFEQRFPVTASGAAPPAVHDRLH